MKKHILLALPLLFASCATPQASLCTYQIAGGKTIRLPVYAGGARSSETARIKIDVTGFMIDGDKAELTYVFGFTSKTNQALRAVTVEDVTGATAVTLVDDPNLTFDTTGYWKGESTPRRAGDSSLDWLSVPGDTEKIFRFKITFADGAVEEIYQASIWKGQTKPLVRKALKAP